MCTEYVETSAGSTWWTFHIYIHICMCVKQNIMCKFTCVSMQATNMSKYICKQTWQIWMKYIQKKNGNTLMTKYMPLHVQIMQNHSYEHVEKLSNTSESVCATKQNLCIITFWQTHDTKHAAIIHAWKHICNV